MSSEWPMVKLGDVLTQRKEYIRIDDMALYKRCRVQLHAQGVVLRDAVSGVDIKTKSQQVCRSGEFLVAEIDAKIGGFGIVPKELEGAVVSSHYFLFTINEDRLNHQFLEYFISTPNFQEQVTAQGSTNYAAIRPGDVLGYVIPLPPLDEQRRIVARIDALAERIAEAQRLRVEVVEEIGNIASNLNYQLSKGNIVKLEQVLVLDERKTPVQTGHLYSQVGIRGFGKGLFVRETLDATQTTYKSFNRLYIGAIVLSQVKGWEGAISVCDSVLAGKYVSPEYRTFQCVSDKLIPEYMAALISTDWFQGLLKNLSRGVGARRERTRPEQFLALEIPLPTLSQQLEALHVMAKVDAVKALQAETAAELDALLPSVLDKAFRGDL